MKIATKGGPFGVIALALSLCVSTSLAQKGDYKRDYGKDDIFKGNITNDVRRMLDEGSAEQPIADYVLKNGIPEDRLAEVLNWFVTNGIDRPGSPESGWCKRAINTMGNLRLRKCIPILREISARADKARRETVICAIIRIGGDDGLNFAKEVLTSTNIYRGFARYYVCDCVLRHATAQEAMVLNPPTPEERRKYTVFLLAEPFRDEKLGNVQSVDKQWSRLVKEYRLSQERETFLDTLASDSPVHLREYFTQQLDAMRKER